MTRNKRGLVHCILFVTTGLLLACSLDSRLETSRAPGFLGVENAATITLLTEGDSVRTAILRNPESLLAWNQKSEAFPVGGPRTTWLAQFTLSPSEESVVPQGFYRLPPNHSSYGRLLLSNVFHKPHRLSLIFLFDYQPLLVKTKSGLQSAYSMSEIPVGAEKALEFLFPPLPEGFHHLSILFISDPESRSVSLEYREAQQRSFSEQRFDLWIGIDEPPAGAPIFSDAEQASIAGAFRAQFNLVNLNTSPYTLIDEIDLEPSAEFDLGLLFAPEAQSSNSPPYTGTLPLRIGVFWNDYLCTASDYNLYPNRKLSEPMLLPYGITAPNEPGYYQLHIVVWTFPWHPLFDADGEWIAFPNASFSRRVSVTVADR